MVLWHYCKCYAVEPIPLLSKPLKRRFDKMSNYKSKRSCNMKQPVIYTFVCFALSVIFVFIYPFIHNSPKARIILARYNRVAQVYLALSAYHDSYDEYPSLDNSNHSWRVMILPFLYRDNEEKQKYCSELYENIRLEESWDSEYNRQFHSVCIDVFCSLAVDANLVKDKNNFYMFRNDNQKDDEPFFIEDITRQSCWMNPNDSIEYDSKSYVAPASCYICSYNGALKFLPGGSTKGINPIYNNSKEGQNND